MDGVLSKLRVNEVRREAGASAPTHLRAFSRARREVVRLGFHPVQERGQFRMRSQRFDSVVLTRQLGFAQQRMNLPMTHAVQKLRVPPAFAFGHQVVCVRDVRKALR